MALTEYLEWASVPATAVALFEANRDEFLEKGAASPLLTSLATGLGFRPGENNLLSPGPLTATLLGGLVGGGLGYGAGSLASAVLPDDWDKKKLRRNLALSGAALVASPGMAYMGANMLGGRSAFEPSWRAGYTQFDPPKKPNINPSRFVMDPYTNPQLQMKGAELLEKNALLGGWSAMRPIDVNEFNQVIWKDPRVAGPLPPAYQAAATGLVTGAANLPGKRNTAFVTPSDIGRMAAGMGSGYASGVVVGKALGALLGMPEEAQDRLKSTGMWAGIVANAIPIIFGN